MKKKLSILLFVISLNAADTEPPQEKSIKLSGYINSKAFWDSRQVVGTSEDLTVFFPEPKVCSPTGDVNSHGHCQVLPFETRIRITMQEPIKEHNFKATGVVEIEFKGKSEAVNLMNMRHAFGQVDWDNSTFIFGQTWHPLNVDELMPNTVSFNFGRPFAVYNRSPQLRYTYHAPSIDFIFYAGSQVDFSSDGPIGLSTKYIRNAVIPNLDFQIKTFFGEHVIGTGIDYQRIAPRIVSDKGYKVHEMLSSLIGIWYLGLNWEKMQIKNTILFGGNTSNNGILGGYAVKNNSINPITGSQEYTNLRTLAAWSDLTFCRFKIVETGIFLGVAKNFGSKNEIIRNEIDPEGNAIKTIYGLGNTIDLALRISPRIRINIKQLTIAGEIEYTKASYGCVTKNGTVIPNAPVGNTQLLLSTFLFF